MTETKVLHTISDITKALYEHANKIETFDGAGDEGNISITLSDIRQMVKTIKQEYNNVIYVPSKRVIRVSTKKNIVIDGVNFGKFDISILLSNVYNYCPEIRIYRRKYNDQLYNKLYSIIRSDPGAIENSFHSKMHIQVNYNNPHPHVFQGALCLGDGEDLLLNAYRNFDIVSMFEIIVRVLEDDSEGTEGWGPTRCVRCGKQLKDVRSAKICTSCNEIFCLACARKNSLKEHFCHQKTSTGNTCPAFVCICCCSRARRLLNHTNQAHQFTHKAHMSDPIIVYPEDCSTKAEAAEYFKEEEKRYAEWLAKMPKVGAYLYRNRKKKGILPECGQGGDSGLERAEKIQISRLLDSKAFSRDAFCVNLFEKSNVSFWSDFLISPESLEVYLKDHWFLTEEEYKVDIPEEQSVEETNVTGWL